MCPGPSHLSPILTNKKKGPIGPSECKVVTLNNYFLAAFFSCFAAFFSFGVLVEAFLSFFLLSWPLAMALAPCRVRWCYVLTIYVASYTTIWCSERLLSQAFTLRRQLKMRNSSVPWQIFCRRRWKEDGGMRTVVKAIKQLRPLSPFKAIKQLRPPCYSWAAECTSIFLSLRKTFNHPEI